MSYPTTEAEPATLRILSSPRAGGPARVPSGALSVAVNAMGHSNGDQGLWFRPRGWACQAALGRPVTPGPALPGLFVYPLDEHTTVIGFEAVIADRVVTVQIKDKAKIEGGHFEATGIRAATVTGKRAGGAVAGPGCGWSLGQTERGAVGSGRESTVLRVGNPV